MKIIVGLGNPGEKYESTRHNLGFLVLDRLLKDCAPVNVSNWKKETKFKSEVVELPIHGVDEKILLVRPQTYMNNSGMAVQLLSTFYKLSPEDFWIVHDELDLPLGTLKIRFGGAAAGHHGVENIIEQLGSDKFWRFRLGIGHVLHNARETDDDGKSHALGDFIGKDRTEAKKMIKHASDALQIAIEKGLEVAQNRFNTK
jgi:PTH1 family peptidyl-tRNA hydrolase